MLQTLILQNFRSHATTTINFGAGLNIIVGENGSGKSSILLAVGLCLFDSGFGLKQYIRQGEQHAKIEVVLTHGEDTIRVCREFGRFSLYRIYQGETVIADGLNAVREELTHRFGLSISLPTAFDELVGVKQFAMVTPFTQPPAARKEFFDQMLGVTEYERVYQNLRAGVKYAGDLEAQEGTKLVLLKQEQGQMDAKRMEYDRLRGRMVELDQEIGRKTYALTQLDAQRLAYSKQQVEEGKRWQLTHQQEADRNSLGLVKASLVQLEMRVESFTNQLKGLKLLREQVPELERSVAGYRAAKVLHEEAEAIALQAEGRKNLRQAQLVDQLNALHDNQWCFICGAELSEEKRQELIELRNSELDLFKQPFTLTTFVLTDPTPKLDVALYKLSEEGYFIDQVKEAEKEIAALTAQVEAIINRLDVTQQALIDLGNGTEEMADPRSDYERVLKELGWREGELAQLQKQMEQLETSLQRDVAAEIVGVETEIQTIKATAETISEIRQVYRQLGPLVAARFLAEINHRANTIFNDLLGEHYPVGLTVTDSYEVMATITQSHVSFNLLSGGQQVLAALSLRLALMNTLSRLDFVLIDEPFDSLDPLASEAVVKQLSSMRSFNQLIVIVHQDLFDADHVIKLELSREGKSEVV